MYSVFEVAKGRDAAELYAKNGGYDSLQQMLHEAIGKDIDVENCYWIINDECQDVCLPDHIRAKSKTITLGIITGKVTPIAHDEKFTAQVVMFPSNGKCYILEEAFWEIIC